MISENVKVYEVLVFAVGEDVKEKLIGSWRGPADSELKAKEQAEADVWQERFTEQGLSPSHGIREVPRYLAADRWFHAFDGAGQGLVRWAYDRADGEVVHAMRKDGGAWFPLTKTQQDHLQGILEDVFEVDADPTCLDGVVELEGLPEWAATPGAPRGPEM